MAFEPKDMSGVLFKNERKTKDTHPDYQGNALINGVELELACWIKTSANGKKRLSMSFKSKQDKGYSVITDDVSFDDGDIY